MAIYDATGNRKVEYAYDAFGNCKVIYTNNSDLANSNPIRYRSYYYDRETKLYYLNARYYNPEWRRFISPDDTAYLDPESINGLNLYAYCNNDPVNYCDPSGHFLLSAILVSGAIMGIIGFGATVYADYKDDGQIFNGSISVNDYIANTLVSISLGALTGGLIYTFAPAIGGFLGSSFTIGSYALAGGGVATMTVSGAQILGGALATSLGIAFFSKPSSGRIRFSDGTGIDPLTGKPVTNSERAYEIYRSLNDPIKKANWRKWMKGKGWRTNHLK